MHMFTVDLEHVKGIWGHSVHLSLNSAITQEECIIEQKGQIPRECMRYCMHMGYFWPQTSECSFRVIRCPCLKIIPRTLFDRNVFLLCYFNLHVMHAGDDTTWASWTYYFLHVFSVLQPTFMINILVMGVYRLLPVMLFFFAILLSVPLPHYHHLSLHSWKMKVHYLETVGHELRTIAISKAAFI